MSALRAEVHELKRRHLVARVWPQVKKETDLTIQTTFDRYRELCHDFGIAPRRQPGGIGEWLRGKTEPDLEHGLVLLMVFSEALEKTDAEIDDPLFGGSPGNRTLNLRTGSPLPPKSAR